MIKVNTESLKAKIALYETLINKYEEVTYDLFKTLERTSDFWQDPRANFFYSQIAEQKMVTRKLQTNMKKRKNFYEEIYKKYSKFGKTIACDVEQKQAMLQKLSYGIEQLDLITRRFNNLDIFFVFSQKNALLEQKRRITKLRNEWRNYQNALTKFLGQVDDIESEMKRKLKELEEIKIEPFILTEQTGKVKTVSVSMNLIEMNSYIPKIRVYCTEEERSLNKIKAFLRDISDCYESNNATEQTLSNERFVHNFPLLVENRQVYIATLQASCRQYKEVSAHNVKLFQETNYDEVKKNG